MSRKKSKRRGKFLFFIPVAAVVALVVFALVSYTSNQSGTLVVEALSSSRYSPSVMLGVPVTVDTYQGRTPVNLTLGQGEHTVIYGAIPWYKTPPSRSIFISGGKTEYAVTIYHPVIKAISVNDTGFNATSIIALHGVTPVVWLNQGNTMVALNIDTVGRVVIDPSRNFTLIFSSTGTFGFAVPNSQYDGAVHST